MEEPTEHLTPMEVITNMIASLTQNLKDTTEFHKKMIADLKSLQKDVKKIKPKKQQPKDETNTSTRVSGFDIPVIVSEPLKKLLELDNAEYSRKEITALVTKYIKTNNLQMEENKRLIILDASDAGKRLADVLLPDQPLTFFNMQRYLSKHYTKKEVVNTVPTVHANSPVISDTVVPSASELPMPNLPTHLDSISDAHNEVAEDTDDTKMKVVIKKRVKKHA